MEWLEAVVADEMPLVGDLDYEGSLRAVASLIDVYIGRPSPARMEDTDLFDEAVQLAVWMMHHRERLTPAHQKTLESTAMVWRWFESESERRDAETTIRRHMPHDMVEWWEAALGPTPPMPIPDDANEFHNRLEDHMLPSVSRCTHTHVHKHSHPHHAPATCSCGQPWGRQGNMHKELLLIRTRRC